MFKCSTKMYDDSNKMHSDKKAPIIKETNQCNRQWQRMGIAPKVHFFCCLIVILHEKCFFFVQIEL